MGPIVAAAGDESTLNNIPLPTDPVFTDMRIYRSLDGGAYELVEQVAANTTYVHDDAAVGAPLNADSLDLVSYSYFITYSNADIESRPNAQSSSVTISSGNRRMRLEDIPPPAAGSEFNQINIYRNISGDPGNYYLVDTLPSTGVPIDYIDSTPDADIAGNQVLDRNGPPIYTGLPLVNVSSFNGTGYVSLFELGTDGTAVLRFTGSKGSPTPLDLPAKELEITADTTVQELITFMQQSLGIENDPAVGGNPGGGITADSRIFFESNMGDKNELSIDEASFSLIVDDVPQGVPLDFTTTQEGNGEGSTTEMIVFDSLGIPLTVRLTTVLVGAETGATTYRWFATSGDNQVSTGIDTTIGTGLITFDGQGTFTNATNSTISIQRLDVASVTPVNVDVDFSQLTAVSKQNGISDVQMSNQDGFPSGTLASFSITESGLLKGVYTNGVTRDLGQVVMARFTNSGGLQQVGDSLFSEGVNSGTPLRGIPGDAGIGAITAGAVELSNSDIGQNLVKLILASTQYRGGTRVITTAQQLLDELLSLRR
jgi:flagellar hook protein FlgE